MNDIKFRTEFTNRQFVAMVRTKLAAAGRTDVTIERSWIDEDEPGYRFLLHVPIGTDLTVPLRPAEGFFDARSDKSRDEQAAVFAKALINLRSAERRLIKYAKDVGHATNKVVAKARDNGLDILLVGVGFKPTYVHNLTSDDWKDAASQVLAAVKIRHTSFYLQREVSEVWIEEPEDVARELADILTEERERQSNLDQMEADGYDLTVDQISLDLLAHHGLDAADILRKVWKTQCVTLSVKHNGSDVSLSLISSEGVASASIMIEDAFWNGEYLWFSVDDREKDRRHLIGQAVGDHVRHPVFAPRPIMDICQRRANDPIRVVLDLSVKYRFDADTGRLWREERLAA